MYYLFIKKGHTSIVIYTSGNEKDARKIYKQVTRNNNYISKELTIFAQSPSLFSLGWLIDDESIPVFYDEDDSPIENSDTF